MNIKEEKGITLVALIITIILLIILTAVVIRFALGEEVLDRTSNFVDKTEQYQNVQNEMITDVRNLYK